MEAIGEALLFVFDFIYRDLVDFYRQPLPEGESGKIGISLVNFSRMWQMAWLTFACATVIRLFRYSRSPVYLVIACGAVGSVILYFLPTTVYAFLEGRSSIWGIVAINLFLSIIAWGLGILARQLELRMKRLVVQDVLIRMRAEEVAKGPR